MSPKPIRLAYVVSHPIQYQAPLFRRLARDPRLDFEVLFCHDHGVKPSLDRGFGRVIQYDVPLTDGYRHQFLPNVAPSPGVRFAGQINPRLWALIRSGEFDAVALHGYSSISNLIALLERPLSKTRLLLRGESHLHEHRPLLKRAAKAVGLRTLFKLIVQFIAIGSWNRHYYEQYGVDPDRITLAPYAVDNERFEAASAQARSDRRQARVRLGLPGDRPVFLFSAKLISVKRPLDAVRALAIANRTTPCALAMVGDGELRDAVQREATALGVARHVHLLGFRNQSELPEIYGACDALVLPSEKEPWGLVVNEAMACGTPAVVSNRVGAGPDLVHGTGAVYPVGDVERLADVFERWASTPGALGTAQRAAVDRIRSWGMQQAAEGILTAVERATTAPARFGRP